MAWENWAICTLFLTHGRFPVLYHHGISAAGGHYTLDVLHPERIGGSVVPTANREGWIRIDDEFVSDIRAEDVFQYLGGVGGDDRCAYLLFYART
jgi:ubiquitin carboxyl-terminal hydrolase 10